MPKDSQILPDGSGRRGDRNGRSRRPGLYDVLIVGGGPAGLSAALLLGRCRRRVLVVDSGHPRNAVAPAMHGYLSRDGINPRDLLQLGRSEVERYGVEVLDAEVHSARGLAPDEVSDPLVGFEVVTGGRRRFHSRKLLLATGVRDVLPPIEGVERYFGRGVYHCPYCDAWEHRDSSLVAYGTGHAAAGLALSLRTWSSRVTACTGGKRVGQKDRDRLTRNGIGLRTERIVRLDGSEEALQGIVFASGPPLECDALFFDTGQVQRSQLPAMLGCRPQQKNQVHTHNKQRTCVPGLFLAGDADGDVQFVIVAAAEGARAATAIHRELQDEDRGEAGPRMRRATTSRANRD